MAEDRSSLAEMQRLARQERELHQKNDHTLYGGSATAYSDLMAKRKQALIARNDHVAAEATGHFILFLRNLFNHQADYTWVNNGEGNTDLNRSTIWIESIFSLHDRGDNLEIPGVFVTPGPSSNMSIAPSDLRHWNRLTGTRTKTGFRSGTVQLLVTGESLYEVQSLASHIHNSIVLHTETLQHQGFYKITEVAEGGVDAKNPLWASALLTQQRNAVAPLTIAYIWQWTARLTPKPDSVAVANNTIYTVHARGEDDPELYGVIDPSNPSEIPLALYVAGPLAEE